MDFFPSLGEMTEILSFFSLISQRELFICLFRAVVLNREGFCLPVDIDIAWKHDKHRIGGGQLATNHPTIRRTTLTTGNYLAQNVSSAKV